jgi:uncharacterized protein YneF (UPF0154 family)
MVFTELTYFVLVGFLCFVVGVHVGILISLWIVKKRKK